VRGSSYLPDESQKRVEAYWVNSSRMDILRGIRSRYTAAVPPGVFRILVLGSSQTWGAGAESDDDTWVRQLETLLNTSPGDVKVECINAGISGLVTGQVVELLRSDLADMAASAALINLSNNDIDLDQFEHNLDALIGELQARNIRPVFILEPNSLERRLTDSEHGHLEYKHAIMRKVAANYGLPAIDLHGYLAEAKDAGFIWWDFVHLTSFGQRLVAAKLAGDLPSLLGIDGRHWNGLAQATEQTPTRVVSH
jgi:lysophospholipase L1-like esterase